MGEDAATNTKGQAMRWSNDRAGDVGTCRKMERKRKEWTKQRERGPEEDLRTARDKLQKGARN